MNWMTGSPSPRRADIGTSSPPHSWSCLLKPPAMISSIRFSWLRRVVSMIVRTTSSLLGGSRSSEFVLPGMYTDTAGRGLFPHSITTAVTSLDPVGTLSCCHILPYPDTVCQRTELLLVLQFSRRQISRDEAESEISRYVRALQQRNIAA